MNIAELETKQMKNKVPALKAGDIVRVHQKIEEGGKTRVQVFEGTVISVTKPNTVHASILVRKVSYGVGVEKGFLLHSPWVQQIEIVRGSKARRAKLFYLRKLSGKATRLKEKDREMLNLTIREDEPVASDDAGDISEGEAAADVDVAGDDDQSAGEAVVPEAEATDMAEATNSAAGEEAAAPEADEKQG